MNRPALKSIAKLCNTQCFLMIYFLPVLIQVLLFLPLLICIIFRAPIAIVLILAFGILFFLEPLILVATNNYCLINLKGQSRNLKNVVSPFKGAKKYFTIIAVQFLTIIMIALGLILLIVPGIILSYGLRMTNYILCEKKKIGVFQTIKLSLAMTKGHKMELFVNNLSFIGWFLLGGITFGLAYIWVQPYKMLTDACFYEALKYKFDNKEPFFDDFLFNDNNYPGNAESNFTDQPLGGNFADQQAKYNNHFNKTNFNNNCNEKDDSYSPFDSDNKDRNDDTKVDEKDIFDI